jgi:hypothetical protein
MYLVEKLKEGLTGLNPWLPIFIFVVAFHLSRGAMVDALIFGAGATLMIADWKRWIPWHMPERPKVSGLMISVVLGISFAILLTTERNGWQDKVLLLALAPIALVMVYYRDHGPKPSANRIMARTKWIWMSLALFMAVAELFAYIFASVYKDDQSFPTISVLVNPVLESPIGRAIFLVIWLLIGVGLLQVRKGRKVS